MYKYFKEHILVEKGKVQAFILLFLFHFITYVVNNYFLIVLFQSTNLLLSRSQKPNNSSAINHEECEKYKFNFNNFNDVDHRLKLYFYQTKFEEEGEHFKWIVRGKIYNTNTSSLFEGVVVLSTTKCYVMEIYAPENDDVTKWLRQVVSVTVDRLEFIQLLPWKIGLTFYIRDWGSFLLLLQDILRTDSLLLYFASKLIKNNVRFSPSLPKYFLFL